MPKELKFRLWDTAKKEWHTGRDFLLDLDGDVLFNLGCGGLSKCDYACRDQVVCQFTGLKDKNGKEIYEGDILASRGNYITDECNEHGDYPDLTNIVVWNTKMSRFGLIPTNEYNRYKDGPFDCLWSCPITTFREIIGNVFENPDLCK